MWRIWTFRENTCHPEIGFNYLGDFGESAGGEQEWGMSPYTSGASLGPENHRVHTLEMNGMTLEGMLQFRLSYNHTILDHIDFLTDQVDKLDIEIEKRMEESQEDIERLDSIPGIGKKVAEQMIAELGTNIKEQFPTATPDLVSIQHSVIFKARDGDHGSPFPSPFEGDR
ncbi:hypothetical protein ACQ0QQ_22295 [Lysinibacillus sphaericus]